MSFAQRISLLGQLLKLPVLGPLHPILNSEERFSHRIADLVRACCRDSPALEVCIVSTCNVQLLLLRDSNQALAPVANDVILSTQAALAHRQKERPTLLVCLRQGGRLGLVQPFLGQHGFVLACFVLFFLGPVSQNGAFVSGLLSLKYFVALFLDSNGLEVSRCFIPDSLFSQLL